VASRIPSAPTEPEVWITLYDTLYVRGPALPNDQIEYEYRVFAQNTVPSSHRCSPQWYCSRQGGVTVHLFRSWDWERQFRVHAGTDTEHSNGASTAQHITVQQHSTGLPRVHYDDGADLAARWAFLVCVRSMR
jgi:hypothetical protein